MHGLSIGLALLLSLAIIAIGIMYLANPRAATRGFGLPLPEEGPNVAWWLRLKGVRDIVSGLIVLALLAWDGSRTLGIVLLVQAMIPIGDMLVILVGKGSVRSALGIHGVTAMVMILTAIPLTMGAH
jgi:Domain of unknown function (DUF4267)